MIEDDLRFQADVREAKERMSHSQAARGFLFHLPKNETESPIERATFAIQLAVADLFIAILSAETIAEARQVRELIIPLVALLETCEGAALDKAEALNK